MAAIPRVLPPQADPPDSTPTVGPLNESDAALWDAFVRAHPQGSLFHTTTWLDSVQAAFGHEPLHLVARRGREWSAVLPIFCVRSWLAGTMLVSVPYAVYGGALGYDEDALDSLLRAARRLAELRRVRCIDLRSQTRCFQRLSNVDRYATFRRTLPDAVGGMDTWLPRKARAVARNAETKHGLTIRTDPELLPVVYRLYAASMKRLASINYPYRFFRELVERSGADQLVSVVFQGERPVAGLVSFIHNGTVLPYFVGSSKDGKQLGAYHYVYQETARQAVERGCHTFDFGRSRLDNLGACEFKRLQGFQPTPLGYQCDILPGAKAPNLSPSNPRFRWARRIWPMLPAKAASCLGAALARHIPG